MAVIGNMKARLLVQVAKDPVEIATFEIPISASAGFGDGLSPIQIELPELRSELADALEEAAKQLRGKP